MKLLTTLIILTIIIISWVTVIRPWLRYKPWCEGFFAKIEPFEIWIYNKSESILWARWQQFLGIVLILVGVFGGIDYSLLAFFTPEWVHPVLPLIPSILNITGTIAERLRRDTTKPLEVVELPVVKPPEVAHAVARSEVATTNAVAAIEIAKAEGTV